MEKQGTSGKPLGSTELLNNLVISEKHDGRLCVYLDPKYLNKVFKREHHPITSLEKLPPQLFGSTVFSKLDVKQRYRNMKLDSATSPITTFHIPFGRNKFLRMVFGLRVSQDILHRKNEEI